MARGRRPLFGPLHNFEGRDDNVERRRSNTFMKTFVSAQYKETCSFSAVQGGCDVTYLS